MVNPKIVNIFDNGMDIVQKEIGIKKLGNYGKWHQTMRELPHYYGEDEKENLSNLVSRYITKDTQLRDK